MKYANRIGYTDIKPFEIIKETPKSKKIKGMQAELHPDFKPEFEPGGFCAVCKNNENQVWIIKPDPEGEEVMIRIQKNGNWKDKHGNKYKLSIMPIRFYDYNF